MEKYDAKQLFLHLVTPTLIVIITVVQLHYCHSKFLELSTIPENQHDDGVSKTSSAAYGTFVPKQDDTDNEDTEDITDFLETINIRKLSKHDVCINFSYITYLHVIKYLLSDQECGQ